MSGANGGLQSGESRVGWIDTRSLSPATGLDGTLPGCFEKELGSFSWRVGFDDGRLPHWIALACFASATVGGSPNLRRSLLCS